MGRIKTRLLKAATKSIMDKHSSKVGTDFTGNKKVVTDAAEVSSKKLRNIIAGYATRLKKTGKY